MPSPYPYAYVYPLTFGFGLYFGRPWIYGSPYPYAPFRPHGYYRHWWPSDDGRIVLIVTRIFLLIDKASLSHYLA
jgi:hypothetical protein